MYSKHPVNRYIAVFSVALVTTIYLAHWFVYHIICTPHPGWALLFNVLFVLALWSYLRTCCTDPGTPDSVEWKEWDCTRTDDDKLRTKETDAKDDRGSIRRRGYMPNRASWCNVCTRERPERSHHCSQCGVCVLRMDHHCPWIGTCVGWRNHKFFVLLCWWSCCASVCFLATMRGPSAMDGIAVIIDTEQKHVALAPLVCIMASIIFSLVTGGMFMYAFVMVGRNVTAIEEMFYGKNPYSYPSWMDNFRQLFGPLDYKVFFPVNPSAHRKSGATFPLPGGSTSAEDNIVSGTGYGTV